MPRRGERGVTFIETAVVIAIIGIIATAVVPSFLSLRRRAAVRAAAQELRAIFHLARSRAIARATNSGVKFARRGDQWTFAIYDDGDGDGVRNDDIASGVDRPYGGPRLLLAGSRAASISLPPEAIYAPDGERLKPRSSPVRFGSSTICSFSPLGEASPGTIYLTDGTGNTYAVRVFGGSARIRLLRLRGGKRWEAS